MPRFEIPTSSVELHRRAVMLDTNVVYAAFAIDDAKHNDSRAYLEMEDQYLLPLPVIVETWGLLVGRSGNWTAGFSFLSWIIDPRNNVVVVNHSEDIASIRYLAESLRLDCVDATMIYLADKISRECGYAQGFRIATFDTADFLKSLSLDRKFRFSLVDLNSLEDLEFSAG